MTFFEWEKKTKLQTNHNNISTHTVTLLRWSQIVSHMTEPVSQVFPFPSEALLIPKFLTQEKEGGKGGKPPLFLKNPVACGSPSPSS